MGDRIVVFNQGRIEQVGRPLELYNHPANEFVATFLGAPRINLVDRPAADAPGPHRALWDALTANAPASVQRVGLRPEHLRVTSAEQGVPARLVHAEHLGDTSILHLEVAGVKDLINAKLPAGQGTVAAGETVGLVPDVGWALRFDAEGRCLP